MSKWIAEFELEDGDTMPEHMDLEYKGVRIDFHCKPQKPTSKNDLGVDWDELKRKILMEVDGGTDDAWLAYGEVCDRISNSIDEFVADMRGNAKRKGEPIEGNNESYNCENWIP